MKWLVHPLRFLIVNSPQLPSGNLVLRFEEQEAKNGRKRKTNYLRYIPNIYLYSILLTSGIIRYSISMFGHPSEVISCKSGSFIESLCVCCWWLVDEKNPRFTRRSSKIHHLLMQILKKEWTVSSFQLIFVLAQRWGTVMRTWWHICMIKSVRLYFIEYKSHIYIIIVSTYIISIYIHSS